MKKSVLAVKHVQVLTQDFVRMCKAHCKRSYNLFANRIHIKTLNIFAHCGCEHSQQRVISFTWEFRIAKFCDSSLQKKLCMTSNNSQIRLWVEFTASCAAMPSDNSTYENIANSHATWYRNFDNCTSHANSLAAPRRNYCLTSQLIRTSTLCEKDKKRVVYREYREWCTLPSFRISYFPG